MSREATACDLCASTRGIIVPWVVDNATRLLCMSCRARHPQGDAAAISRALSNLAANLAVAGFGAWCFSKGMLAVWTAELNRDRRALDLPDKTPWRPGWALRGETPGHPAPGQGGGE